MLPENPIIFLLEDSPHAAFLIERTVLKELPNARLLWAQTIEEAKKRAEGLEIELFLADVNLPDGNGLNFLWEMSATHPQARAIVMTATPLPEHEATTAALGVLYYLEKPLNVPLFVSYLRLALGTEHVTGPRQGWRAYEQPAEFPDAERHFRATLGNLSVIDIIQLKCLTHATTVVQFKSGLGLGSIHFQEGELVDAEAGALSGADAVFEIARWRNGEVSEEPLANWGKRTIHQSWHAILLEAAQLMDEGSAAT